MTISRLDANRNDKLFDLAVQDAYRLYNTLQLESSDLLDDSETGSLPEIPAGLDDKVIRMIRRREKQRRRYQACRFARRAAVIVLIVLIVSAGTLMNVQAFREEAIRFWVNWSDQFVQIVLNPDSQESQGFTSDPASPAAAVFYQPGYLPEGLTCVKDITNTAGRWRLLVYQSADGLRNLTFNQSSVSGGGTLFIDTEHSGSEEITVRGLKGILVTNAVPGEGENKLWWKDQTMSFLISSNLTPEELIRVAESLEIEP
ncbi:MAG: DUF4367 domain-containing protein [Clostridiaceae bacterium]|nr:DUF4367 domain-containing protein [Clostridiaceae bacterium]